jgi:hypothetical protein
MASEHTHPHTTHLCLMPGLRCEYTYTPRERYPSLAPAQPLPTYREQLRGPGPHPWWRRVWWWLTDRDLG